MLAKILLVALFLGSAHSRDDYPEVKIEGGIIRGMTNINRFSEEYDEFLGVPFAKPPLANLRFRSPEKPESWDGVLPCLVSKPACAQIKEDEDSIVGEEDCLYIDVYRPTTPRHRNESLPVLIWIHGGAYIFGDSEKYHGDTLSTLADIIVVVIQYRLDVFGFLALDALRDEQGSHGSTGNYGLQDQRMAFEWVRDNIRSFGGDPSKVTISGQSAGGGSVCAHLHSSRSKGLFSRAIMMSPICDSPVLLLGYKQATNFGIDYSDSVGCKNASDLVKCLRELPVAKLTPPLIENVKNPSNYPQPRMMPFFAWSPVIDGSPYGVEQRSLDAIKAGAENEIELMTGSVHDEGSVFILLLPIVVGYIPPMNERNFEKAMQHLWPDKLANEVFRRFGGTGAPKTETKNIITENIFACNVRANLRAMEQSKIKTKYQYMFNHTPPNFMGNQFGAFHSAEVKYMFGEADEDWKEDDFTISLHMQCAFGAFIRSGNPNDIHTLGFKSCESVNIPWSQYASKTDLTMVFQSTKPGLVSGYLKEECDWWDNFGYSNTIH
eukprot:m.55670 g.55670  ORF g.55670 m.55670 type:complete len:549 (-) comp10996_c1_seq4:84-1730(-)